jgi:ABC-2 type transport system permease protein
VTNSTSTSSSASTRTSSSVSSSELSRGLAPYAAVRLVAGRELASRIRSKAFVIGTVLMTLLVVLLSVGVSLFHHSSATQVGVVPAGSSLARPIVSSASSLGETVHTVTVPDQATGEQEVRAGSLDALVLYDGSRITAVVKRNVSDSLQHTLNVLAGQVAFNQQITRLGGDPAAVQAAVGSAAVQVDSLLPPKTYDSQQLVLGIAVGILIYIALLSAGQLVAQGVVEEKSTRVVELLLATIRPWQLMAGKVIGIGLLGLIQVGAIGGVGLAAALATGALSLSVSAATGTIVWLVVWFLLGFLAYALAFAAAAALVSRQEDAQAVVLPIMMLLIGGYVIGISVLPSNPGSGFVAVLSLIPVFAPELMPMRLAMGGVPIWQAALSVALIVALIPVLVAVAGRIYRNAVVQSGARVKLSQAFRSQ